MGMASKLLQGLAKLAEKEAAQKAVTEGAELAAKEVAPAFPNLVRTFEAGGTAIPANSTAQALDLAKDTGLGNTLVTGVAAPQTFGKVKVKDTVPRPAFQNIGRVIRKP